MGFSLEKFINSLVTQATGGETKTNTATGGVNAAPVVVDNPTPYAVKEEKPEPSPIQQKVNEGVKTGLDFIKNLGTPKAPKMTEEEFYADPTLSGPDGKYGSYNNFRTNTVTDAYKSGSGERAWGILTDSRGGTLGDRLKAMGGALSEVLSVSESQRAAKLGLTVPEFHDYQRKELAVKDATAAAKAARGNVSAAEKILAGIQDEINATYAENYGAGNINLADLPRFDDGNGNYSYIATTQFYDPESGLVLLIPAMEQLADGSWKPLDQADAITRYRQTGEYFGAFNNQTDAQQYANDLTAQQEELYGQRAELSAQFQANRDAYRELVKGYNNGVGKELSEATDAFDYEYNPVQYYLNKGQSLTDIDNAIEGLDAILAVSEAGSLSYDSAKRRRDALVANRVRFATDEELEEMYASAVDEDAQEKANERLAQLVRWGVDPQSDREYMELLSQSTAERVAAGQEIERRDAIRIVEAAKDTDAGKYVDGLAQYAATGEIIDDLIKLFGLEWDKDRADMDPNDASILSAMGVKVRQELMKQIDPKTGEKYTRQAAANVVDSLQREGNRLYTERTAEEMQDLTNDNEIAMSALSVLENTVSGLGMLEGARVLFGDMTNRTADPNSLWFSALNDVNAVRGTVTENHDLDVKIGEKDFDLFDFGYGITMSSLDSMMAALFPGRTGGALIGSQAAAQSLQESAQRGVPIGDAVLTAIMTGVNEGLWESVTIGNLKSMRNLPTITFSDVLKNVGKQAIVNGSEELNTEIANLLFDYMKYVSGNEFTDYALNLAGLMTQINPETGKIYTEKEAKTRLLIDMAVQCAESGASGFVQGALMGATSQIGSIRKTKAIRANTDAHFKDYGKVNMLSWAAMLDENSEGYKLGKRLSDELDAINNVEANDPKAKADALDAYWARTEASYAELENLISDARMDGTLPSYLTQDYLDAQAKAIEQGDEVPPHVETPTEANIRETLESAGMPQAGITEVTPLLFKLVNGETVSLRGISADVLKSLEFKNAVMQITGLPVVGNDVSSIRKSLNNIVKQIREGRTITFAGPTDRVEEPQRDLVPPTEVPAPAQGQPAMPAESPDALLSNVVGRMVENAAPVQQQVAEAQPAAMPVQTQPAAPVQQQAPQRRMIRFAAAEEGETAQPSARKLSEEQVRSVKTIQTMFADPNLDIRLVAGDDPILSGAYARNHNGVIYLNADTVKNFGAVAYFVGHEFYHNVEDRLGADKALNYAKDLMKVLVDNGALTGIYASMANSDAAWQALQVPYRNRWAEQEARDKGISKEDAAKLISDTYINGEIAGDFFGALFGYNERNEAKGLISPDVDRMKLLMDFAAANRGAVQEMADDVLTMRDRLEGETGAKAERDQLSDILLRLGTALYFTDKKGESGSGKFRAADLEDMTFADQIDLACVGDIDRDTSMRVGKTGALMRDLGLRGVMQYMTQGKFFLSVYGLEGTQKAVDGGELDDNTHAVTYDTMERLPELIENPAMVYKTRHGVGSEIVVVTTDVDKDGYPVVVIINPDGVAMTDGRYVDANFIESVYGTENLVRNYDDPEHTTLRHIVSEGLLMYADEEKSRSLLQRYQERFPISATSDNEGVSVDSSDPLTGFVFGTIVQKWNPGVKDFERAGGVMEPIRNAETGRVYGNQSEFAEDAKTEAENRGLYYDGYEVKGDSYVAFAVGPDGKTVELFHGEAMEPGRANRADTQVMRGGKNVESRVYVPGGRSDVDVRTADYTTENGEKALLVNSMKADGEDRRSDYALRRTLMRAAQDGYDLLVWADGNAQMNAANPYYMQDASGQVTDQKRLTNVYDKSFTDFFGKYAPVETFYLADAEQSVAPERYLKLQNEQAETMRKLNDLRAMAANGTAENTADLALQTRQLQSNLIEINADMSDIRNEGEKVKQTGATVPGIRITDDVRAKAQEMQGRFAAADLGDDGMYSALQREVEALQTNRNGELDLNTFVKTLKNRAQKVRGLSDEIKWSGLEDWVNRNRESGERFMDKDEVLWYLREYTPVLQEKAREVYQVRDFTVDDLTGTLTHGEKFSSDWDVYAGAVIAARHIGATFDHIDIVNGPDGGQKQTAYGTMNDTGELVPILIATSDGSYETKGETRWYEYKLNGGENYTEHTFKLPGSDYSNDAMYVHWGKNAERGAGEGVVVHVREQTLHTPDGKKVLFIDEVQSDWHNEGSKAKYESKGGTVPDAPYEKTYAEYALKRMMVKAAQEGYDYIAWTSPALQMDRWNPYWMTEDGEAAVRGNDGNWEGKKPLYLDGYRSTYGRDLQNAAQRFGPVQDVAVENVSTTDRQGPEYYSSMFKLNKIVGEIKQIDARLEQLDAEGKGWHSEDNAEYLDLLDQKYQLREEGTKLNNDLWTYGDPDVSGEAVSEVPGIEVTPELAERVRDEGLSRFAAADDTMDYQDFVAGKAANDRQPISAEQMNYTGDYRATRPAVNIPQSGTLPGYVTDRNVQTLINAGITPDEAAQTYMSGIANGAYQHMVYRDEQALEKAYNEIEHFGWAETLGKYRAEVLAGKASKDITAMGVALYNSAATAGHIYDMMDIGSLMIKNASSVGSALQAFRMLNNATPDGRYYMAVRSIENIADELRGLYGDDYHFDLDSAMLDAYRNALISGDEAQQKEVWHEIEQSIADQIPSDWKLKFNNWRYLAMLGNPRTHIRNIVGNLGFMPVRLAKQGLKAVMERMVLGQAGQGSNRTTALLNPFSAEDKARRAAAKADYANVVDLIQSGGKYSSTKGEIENLRTVYDHAKFLEWFRKRNGDLLDKEDTWFSRPAYTEALASFLKARGIDGDAFAAGNIDPNTLNTAREHAILEAQRATYRDTNAFSAWVSSLGKEGRQKNATGVQKAASAALEAVLPFKKTPANILVRAVEYSPAGFAMALKDGIKDVRAAHAATQAAIAANDGSETAWRNINAMKETEDIAVANMLDHISSGLTGTALMGLGMLLAKLGIVTGGKDPDDEQATLDELHGLQEYSISTNAIADRINEATGWHLNLGNVNYTLDWLAPEALPLFTGVTLWNKIKQMQKAEEDESDLLTDAWDLITGMGEPMLNMSMLSSVNDLVSKMSYLDDATQLPALLGQIGYSYVSQFIPTLFGQIERITEPNRQSTYYDRSDGLSKDLQYMLGKTANKIPFWDYNQIPYLDAWGREQESGNILRRVVSNMLSPGYIRDTETSELDDELQRLHDLGFEKMIPQRTTQSTKVDQEYMNEEEYVAYARTKGQTALADLTALTESSTYSNMTDEQKAKAVAKIYEDAKTAAEDEVRKLRGEKVEGTKADEAGLDTATFSAAKTLYDTAEAPSWYDVYNDDGEQKIPNWAKMQAVLDDRTLTKDERLKFVNAISTKKEKFESFDEAVAYYDEAEADARDEIKFRGAKETYDNAKTPDWGKATDKGETPGWAKMLAVLDDKSVNNSTKLEFINAHSGRNDEFQSVDEARTYYTASGIYNSAETPEGYKATDAGNTPGWAKALAVIDSDTLTDDEKLGYINSVSGRKEAFATLDEAQTYYEKQKNKAKQ